jgi:hypothetical protein
VNFEAGQRVEIPILVSHYGRDIPKARLAIRISGNGRVLYRKEIRFGEIPRGAITELYKVSFRMPKCEKPMSLTLTVQLSGGDTDCENRWEIYVFPKTLAPSAKAIENQNVTVTEDCEGTALWQALASGRRVVLLGTGPFATDDVSWQIALAGRTNGHLATVIADHPVFEDFPHAGYCGRQFESMLNESKSVVLEVDGIPHEPILDIASSYKNARREAMMVEYRVGRGKILICSLHLSESDPAATWLKNRILTYAMGETFDPVQALTEAQFAALCKVSPVVVSRNTNEAMNKNDITMLV